MSIYYNLALQNTTNESIPLRFDVALSIPFIQKPSDYDVSVVRFVLPNFDNPFLTYDTDPDFHNMSMSYNGHTVSHHVDYIPRTSLVNDYSIWDVQQCMQMLNATIGQLYTALNAVVTLPTSDMPYFTYSEETKLITFTANKNYFASNLSTPIVVTIDESLLNWLYGLQSFGRVPNSAGVPTLYDILVIDLHNNHVGTDYLEMTQQASSFDRMTDFERIVLTTNLPIANEYLGTSTTLPIIQDYCPSDISVDTFYNNIVYNAIVPYRQTRLISDCAFYSLRFDCYVAHVNGTLKPMILQPNNSANIKLMFTKHERNNFA